ncbi:MAG: DNRLRE domain-containing protein [Armatimonadota bacterium]
MVFPTCMRRALAATVLLGAILGAARAQVAVLTQHNDNQRTGHNAAEATLRPDTVAPGKFGRLFTREVDGEVYAQVLYVPGVTVPGKGVKNLFYVATMNNSVYAFDADDRDAVLPIWKRNFGPAVPQQDVQCCCRDISTKIGILSTPVIDPATGILYVLSRNKLTSGGLDTYRQRLHALDVATGADRITERTISGAYRGAEFDPKIHNQRTALTLHQGKIYVAWASHNDCGRYRGWVMSFDKTTLARQAVWNTAPEADAGMAGIWQSGQGLTVDSDGYLHLMTGNGTFNAASGGSSLGCSFVRLTPELVVADWFTPSNVDFLNAIDADLGSAGVLALPGGDRVAGIGKDGRFYLLDTRRMGGFHADRNDVVQSFGAVDGHVHGSPVVLPGAVGGPLVYIWSEEDALKAFRLRDGQFDTRPAGRSAARVPGGMPGAMLSLSSNGSTGGIVWASHPREGNANQAVVPGVLRAFDATSFEPNGDVPAIRELWNSEMAGTDRVGRFAKFNPPTVADGKVFLATFGQAGQAEGSTGQVHIYGVYASQKPATPGDVRAGSDVRSIRVFWGRSARAASYTVQRKIGDGVFTTARTGLTGLDWLDPNLDPNKVYSYRVIASNGFGDSEPSEIVTARPLPPPPPSAPRDLVATPVVHAIRLAWKPSVGASAYRLERKVGAGEFSVLRTSVSGTAWTDGNLDPKVEYAYRVFAFNNDGESGASNVVVAQPLPYPRPGRPTGVSATSGIRKATVAWDNVPGATSYKVLRAAAGGEFETVVENLTATRFVDTDRTPGVALTYAVVAVGEGGESDRSAAVGCTPYDNAYVGTVVADAVVSSEYRLVGTGFDPQLLLKGTRNNEARIAYLTFTVPAAGGKVGKAVLRLHGSVEGMAVSDAVRGVTNTSWTEEALRWANRPATGSVLSERTVRLGAASWVEFDVTRHVATAVAAGRTRIGFAVSMIAPGQPVARNHQFGSRESGTPPVLSLQMADR